GSACCGRRGSPPGGAWRPSPAGGGRRWRSGRWWAPGGSRCPPGGLVRPRDSPHLELADVDPVGRARLRRGGEGRPEGGGPDEGRPAGRTAEVDGGDVGVDGRHLGDRAAPPGEIGGRLGGGVDAERPSPARGGDRPQVAGGAPRPGDGGAPPPALRAP